MTLRFCSLLAQVRGREYGSLALQCRNISIYAACSAASPISGKNFYERLGLERDAGTAEIKASYLQLAKIHHPDRASDPDISEHIFRDIAQAYEILKDEATRARYDSQLPKVSANHQHQQHYIKQETVAEGELRTLIEHGDVDAAIKLWREAGASFQELLHIIDCCTREMKVPSDLPTLLFHLHSVEKHGTANAADGASVATSSETAVMNFVERKTRAYNELIRLCDMCGTRKQLFEVLDAMERNSIQIDMETLAQLEDVFTRGTVRDNPNRGR
eukprot:m.146363 g.146363  ORF g.146363 m.146363 type:complete len:274 (-) comp17769_c0_seq2:654-1475(-)